MIVFLASIHHTGTQFTMDLFMRNGFKVFEREYPHHQKPHSIYRQHIEEKSLDSLETSLARKLPLVVPLRHPMRCAQSWTNRRKPVEDMLQQWDWLLEIVAPHGPLYLPIDHVDKELYLGRIEEALDVELRTEWPIVGSKPCSYPMSEKDRAEVDYFVRSTRFRNALGHIY